MGPRDKTKAIAKSKSKSSKQPTNMVANRKGSSAKSKREKQLEEELEKLEAELQVLKVGPPIFDDDIINDKQYRGKLQDCAVPVELKAQWRIFQRDFAEWYRQPHDERAKVASLLHALPEAAKAHVYVALPEGITTCLAIMTVLKEIYGADMMLQNKEDIKAYQNHKREEHEGLEDWLNTHNLIRSRAIGANMPSDDLNGWTLFDDAALSENMQQQVTRSIIMRMNIKGLPDDSVPTYATVLAELRLNCRVKANAKLMNSAAPPKVKPTTAVLATAAVTKTHRKKVTKKKTTVKKQIALAVAAAVAADKKVFVPDWTCSKCSAYCFGSRAECFKCNAPKTGNEALAVKGGKSKGKGKGKGGKGKGSRHLPCLNWNGTPGSCKYEQNCNFSHDAGAAAVKPEA